MSSAEGVDRCDVAIIGGGISGLAAAWALRDHDVCVLEAAKSVGGRLRTETRGRYWLNLGAHVLMAGGPMAALAGEAGVPLVEPPGSFLAVAMSGRVVRAKSAAGMLFALPLALPGRLSLARVGMRMLQARHADPISLERMTFADVLGPMHRDVEALMRVVANRLTGELSDISAHVGVHGFDHLWLGSRLNISGGSAELPRAIAAALGRRVRTGAPVTRLAQTGDNVAVDYEHNGRARRLLARNCIVAVPAPVARALVAGLPGDIDEALAQMLYTPFVVAGFFTRESGPMPWDDLYAVAVPDRSFCMIFNPANALRRGPRPPGGALVVYAVADRAAELLSLSDVEIGKRYLDDLDGIFPEVRGIVDEVVVQRWQHGTALGFPGRSAPLALLSCGFGRIVFAGDYMMPIEGTDASESGLAAARLVRSKMAAEPVARAGWIRV